MANPPRKTPPKPPARTPRATALYTHPTSRKVAAEVLPKPAVKPKMPASPITSPRIKHLAGVATAGGTLTPHEQRELGASVLAHIEPRQKG